MATFFIALVASLNALALIVWFQFSERARRAARLKDLALSPNRLLTRHPIVFISGRPSLFRLFDHWNDIPGFLREHGYDVLVIEPIVRQASPAASVIASLDELLSPVHLVGDGSTRATLEAIADGRHPRVKSLTLVENPRRRRFFARSRRLTADALKPLACAVEPFELKSPNAPWELRGLARTGLLALHNLQATLRGQGTVDALEVGENSDGREIETQFLDLATQLAERDYRDYKETPSQPARPRASLGAGDARL